MIGDVIVTFSNTTQAVNQQFVRKSQIETSTSHSRVLYSKSLYDNQSVSFIISFSGYAIVLRNFYEV